MPGRKEVHTVPKGDGWKNVVNGRPEPTTHRTKETAERAGRQIAKEKQAEHVIHKKDGTIGEKNSYGNDPNPPRDKR